MRLLQSITHVSNWKQKKSTHKKKKSIWKKADLVYEQKHLNKQVAKSAPKVVTAIFDLKKVLTCSFLQTVVVYYKQKPALRNPDQCVLQVNGATLKQLKKFKYLGVTITIVGGQDEKLDTRIGKGSA